MDRHPLHLSSTDISYNAKESSLEIVCRIFTDDLEAVLTTNYKQKVDLLNSSRKKEMDALVAKYVKSHLSYRVNDRLVNANYIGYEVDKEAVNIYFEVTAISSVNSLAVKNTILYDRFDDQINIVHASKSNVRKSAKVNFPQQQMLIQF